MVDKRITQLVEKPAPAVTDLLPIVDMAAGQTKKAYLGNIPVASHKTSHQDGGNDEISVAGLSGILADLQNAIAHKTSHQDGGGDEISVNGLNGVLAQKQDADKIQSHSIDETAIANDRVLVYKITGNKFIYEAKTTPGVHATSHENGGGDEISVASLSGQLGERQDADHIQGHLIEETSLGNDKVLVYKMSGDKFVYEAKGTPAGHHEAHELGGGDQIDCTGLTGASGGGAGGGDFLVMQVFS
jgi:hypothetical protein